MRFKLLGPTGLRVSELCLGTMVFGDARGSWGASREDAARILEKFAAAGGNFLDTANYVGTLVRWCAPARRPFPLAERLREVMAVIVDGLRPPA